MTVKDDVSSPDFVESAQVENRVLKEDTLRAASEARSSG